MKLPIRARIKKYKTSGLKSVVTAVISNVSVALLKLVAWALTGSSVMLSEGIHSIADTANQALLFVGIKRSEKPADEDYQYGYRQERFFWALISACGIFFLGAGITFYQGLTSIFKQETANISYWTFVILLGSLMLEGYSLMTAYKEAKHAAGDEPILKHLKHSGDPTILAVLYEDSAALVGISIAFLSLLLTEMTGNAFWDGLGSILVSVLLATVSILLMVANRSFILNKSVPRHFREKIQDALLAEDLIDEIYDLKTIMIGVDGFIVKAEIEVNGHWLAEKIFNSSNMKDEYEDIKEYHDFVKYSSKLCDRTTRMMGREIDEVERRIIEKIPNIQHIDIEAN